MQEFVPLYSGFEPHYERYVYRRLCDSFNRPVGGPAGGEFDLLERESSDHNWNFRYTGRRVRTINMGSYNYLGFCEPNSACADAAARALYAAGVGSAARQSLGVGSIVRELELKVSIRMNSLKL